MTRTLLYVNSSFPFLSCPPSFHCRPCVCIEFFSTKLILQSCHNVCWHKKNVSFYPMQRHDNSFQSCWGWVAAKCGATEALISSQVVTTTLLTWNRVKKNTSIVKSIWDFPLLRQKPEIILCVTLQPLQAIIDSPNTGFYIHSYSEASH